MARLSKKLKQKWDFFISPKTGRITYTTCAANAGTTVNKAFGQSLCVVLCIALKEVSNPYQTVTISKIRDKRITDIRFKIKRLTEKNFDNFGTFSIQKKQLLQLSFPLAVQNNSNSR